MRKCALRSLGAAVSAAAILSATGCSHDDAPVGAQRSAGPTIVPLPAPAAVESPTPYDPFALYVKTPDGVVVANPKLTPGHASPNATSAVICAPGYSPNIRNAHYNARAAAFAVYGVPWSDRKGYLLDELIPVALGGDNTKDNLWPMPLHGGGSTQLKSELTTRLHDLVCSGQLGLSTAQAAIAANWWAAYQKYGGSPPPPTQAAGTACTPQGARAETKGGKPLICSVTAPKTLRWKGAGPSPSASEPAPTCVSSCLGARVG